MSKSDNQCTLAKSAKIKGVGVHSGEHATLTLHPAPENHGLVFRRVDLEGSPIIPATAAHIVWSKISNRTTLGADGAEVQTSEHVLSALLGMGIDNAMIDLSGPECPAVDNSSMPYVEAIEKAGIEEQEAKRSPLTLTEPITVRDEERGAEVTAMPSDKFEITFFAEFPEGYFLKPQTLNMRVTPKAFKSKIAAARTWIFAEQIPALLVKGLGQGGTRESVLVIGKGEFVTEPRMDDEPVRHKALDLIGDLALLGRPIHAHVMARRSGHAIHAQLVKKILETVG